MSAESVKAFTAHGATVITTAIGAVAEAAPPVEPKVTRTGLSLWTSEQCAQLVQRLGEDPQLSRIGKQIRYHNLDGSCFDDDTFVMKTLGHATNEEISDDRLRELVALFRELRTDPLSQKLIDEDDGRGGDGGGTLSITTVAAPPSDGCEGAVSSNLCAARGDGGSAASAASTAPAAASAPAAAAPAAAAAAASAPAATAASAPAAAAASAAAAATSTPVAAPAPAAALTSEAEKDAGGDSTWVPPARHGLDNRCVRVCVGVSRVLCVCVARRVAQGAIRFRWLCRGAFASQRPRDRASSSLESIRFHSILLYCIRIAAATSGSIAHLIYPLPNSTRRRAAAPRGFSPIAVA